MRVLLFGERSAERVRAMRLLSNSGMTVEVCRDDEWTCAGMDDGCPLDTGGVDVAVAVAARGERFDTQGIACAHRARVPTVTVGATASDPVLRYATRSVARIDERLVDAVEAAAVDVTPYVRAVEEALAARCPTDAPVAVRADRRGDSIHVALHGNIDLARRATMVDVARAAVRGYDPHVAVIDVSIVRPTETFGTEEQDDTSGEW